MSQTLEKFLTKPKYQLQLYSKYQVMAATSGKWKCPHCGFPDNEKTNQNWIRDRLFRCAGCGKIIEGLGRCWWVVEGVTE